MLRARLDGARRIVCLGAHPDDIEIGCGGTIRRWTAERDLEVTWAVLSGEGVRADEARAGAATFLTDAATASVEIADFPDSRFPADWAAIKTWIHDLASRAEPDLVFTHRLEDRHQDHRVVGEIAWQAFRDAVILEYEIPKWEGDPGVANAYVSLDRETVDAKVDALLATFESQREKPWFDAETFRGLMRLRGVECHAADGYAEAFTCRKILL